MDLQTEENKRKFDFRKLIPIGIGIVIVSVIVISIIFIVKTVNNNKKKKSDETEQIEKLNSELEGIYGFAKENNYLVALKKNDEITRIYNLTQGTTNLGDFHDYYYFDKKLYLLFGQNSIYSLSLTDGNGVYELKKEYTYETLPCKDNSIGKPSNIIVTDNIIYFNNSSCGISGFNYGDKNDQVNIFQFSKVTPSNMYYTSGKLFFLGDNSIYEVDEDTGDINKIIENVTGDLQLTVTDEVLLYTNKNSDNTYNYFGYNISTKKQGEFVKNTKKLVIYDSQYIYYDNSGVYITDLENTTQIYQPRYNELSDMELIGDTLQIVDNSTIDNKQKIININLKNNYKTKNVTRKYNLIRMINE